MRNPLGLKGSLAVSFIALALVLLWLNHVTSNDLRSYMVKQREVEKARTVALVFEPMLRHESEWVRSVSHLLMHDLPGVMSLPSNQQALAEQLDRTRTQAEVDVLEVTDEHGIVRYRANEPGRSGKPSTFWGVEEALAGRATLVSVREDSGPMIMYIEPIRVDGKVIGAVCTGKRIDDDFVSALSLEIGANLVLVSRSGKVAATSRKRDTVVDAAAINEAFQHKDVAFRYSEGSRNTQAYLPMLIVDEAWVLIAEIDRSAAYREIAESKEKAALYTISSIIGAILITLLFLRINLLPLRRLRQKAEKLVAEQTGEVPSHASRDDLESIVDSITGLTDVLVERSRLLNEQRAELKISAVAFESQQAMAITDANLEVLTVNQAFIETTGFRKEDVVGRSLETLLPELFGLDRHNELRQALYRTGAWQGEVQNRRTNGETYPLWLSISAVKTDQGVVTHFIISHVDLTENKNAERKIRELAFFDPTTSLPNRRLLMDRLRQAIATCARSATCCAVLIIDIDDFKTLNSVLGHDNGDQLLHMVGQRLSECVREAETVARLGGDEFVVLLDGLSKDPNDAAMQAETAGVRILAAFSAPFQISQADYRCTASIGATLIHEKDISVDELLQQADLALYKAKDTGRDCLQFYDPEMQTSIVERATLENDLRQAIELGQLMVHYQSQVLADGRISGAEALVRWNHPERGLVSPAAFIPLAEKTGLILPLGQWVLNAVCVKLAEWAEQPGIAHLTVAVNVSARQFHHPDFVDQVFATLRETGANPARLKLELTESMLVENIQEVIEKMLTLKASGITFSLDDFGTGYSSLSYLKLLPLEQLKIDQSFVRDILVDPNDAAIAATIITLAGSLGLQVIAEGVETAEQRDFLANSGCHAYQGYFFSKPLPVREFEKHAHSSEACSVPFAIQG